MQDPWQHLRRLTAARIALGRAGGSLPTGEVLKFAMDHALARDAVWAGLDLDRLDADVREAIAVPPEIADRSDAAGVAGRAVVRVTTLAGDRATYLQRPDLGRRLSAESEAILAAAGSTTTGVARASASRGDSSGGFDVAIIVADGLSALAAQRQAPAVLRELVPMLVGGGLSISPVVLATQARVALQDEIGSRLKARCVVTLIGERPGLGTADSLGAYLVFDPKPGKTDADRNCVSNIRDVGLPPAVAAKTLHYLITQALVRRLSGVGLKDERTLLPGNADVLVGKSSSLHAAGPRKC